MNIQDMHEGNPKKNKKRLVIFIILLTAVIAAAAGVYKFIESIKPPEGLSIEKTTNATGSSGKDGEKNNDGIDAENGQRDGVYTFIVAGVDNDKTRTDVLMLVCFDSANKKLNVMSIPRDTMSENGHKGASKKINAAYGRKGGIENTIAEVADLTGVTANRYAVTTFKGFEKIVDAIGGVEFDVPRKMRYSDASQDLYISLNKGLQMIDGKKAIQLVRYRSYASGDLGRIDTTQAFLKTLGNKLISERNIVNIAEIAGVLISECKTDMTAGELTWLANKAKNMTADDISFVTMPGEGKYVQGGSFYIPFGDQILELVNKDFNPNTKPISRDQLKIVSAPYKAY